MTENTKYDLYFFFNETATTEIYTLSLHDALPISHARGRGVLAARPRGRPRGGPRARRPVRRLRLRAGARVSEPLGAVRSEEHTSELQSRQYLVCRLLLEKQKRHISCHTCPVTTHS